MLHVQVHFQQHATVRHYPRVAVRVALCASTAGVKIINYRWCEGVDDVASDSYGLQGETARQSTLGREVLASCDFITR